jgi:hypothetical protein
MYFVAPGKGDSQDSCDPLFSSKAELFKNSILLHRDRMGVSKSNQSKIKKESE